MKKLAVFGLLIVVAMLMAGIFGMIHDQISFTVSPEYFARFKFEQFGFVDAPLPDRVRASMVGFLASWWMGIPIGLLVGAVGFIHRGHQRMLRVSVWPFTVAVGFTLAFGLGGLLYGFWRTRSIHLADYGNWYVPEHLSNLRRYLCVGYMHNSSYIGGALSIPVAWLFQIIARLRQPREVVGFACAP